MRILHVLSSPFFSGAENVACQIIRMLEKTGFEIAYASPNGVISKTLRDLNIKFLPMQKFNIRELKRIIFEFKPDIIHAHDMRASFLVSVCKGRIPYISHIHNNNFNSRGLSLKSIAYLIAALKSKKILWVSKSSFCGYKFSKFLKSKSEILYNVIDLEGLYKKALIASDTEKYDIIFLGRLTYQKNPFRLIEILKKAISYNADLKIVIVGTGDLEIDIKNKVLEYKLNRNITFKGFMDNPLGLLKNAKVMVMCSFWEGTPMCALESMGLGTPVITTPVDGLRDIIDNNENGIFADSDDEFVSAILKTTSNLKIVDTLSLNAISKSKEINNINKYRSKILEIYNSI